MVDKAYIMRSRLFPQNLKHEWRSTKGITFIRHWEAKRGPADTDLGKFLWDRRRWDHISKWTLVKKVMARAGAREAFSRRDPLVGDVLSSPTPQWCHAAERNSMCTKWLTCTGDARQCSASPSPSPTCRAEDLAPLRSEGQGGREPS